MKLQTRLAIVIFTIFFTGWIIAGLSAFALEQKTAHQNSIKSAKLLLSVATATRDYTSTQINPLIASLVEGQTTDQFYPQAVPLEAISHQVEEISLHRVEMSELPENNSDSLDQLNRSINRLLISLNKALEAAKK